MARPSVIPQVRVRLEAYLNEREVEYQAQPEEERRPTLPATADGKVNVRAVAQAIDLKVTQEKYPPGLINLRNTNTLPYSTVPTS